MKNLSFLLLVFWGVGVKAQWVSIPDTNFGTWLNTSYPGCMQGSNAIGWQMDTSCPAVMWDVPVHCNNQNIYDLTGIQYFDNLGVLNCSHNQLNSLPTLPSGLIWLSCNNNQLSSLPSLPPGLILLDCSGNLPLGVIPELPDSLDYFDCSNNSNLNCLPRLNKVIEFYFTGTSISCLPNYPQSNQFSNPALGSVPLCNLSNNIHGCPVFIPLDPIRNPRPPLQLPPNLHHQIPPRH